MVGDQKYKTKHIKKLKKLTYKYGRRSKVYKAKNIKSVKINI